MGKALLVISGIAVLASKALVNGIELSWKEPPTCGYVGEQIYCYGRQSIQSDTYLYSLNVLKFMGQETDSIRDKWEPVKSSTPFDPELRFNSTAIALNDGKKFLIQGGYNAKEKTFTNQTIVYDTTTNSWENASTSQNITQIFDSSAVNLPNNNVIFFGGHEQIFEKQEDSNINSTDFTSIIQMYSPEAKSWAAFKPQNNSPNFSPNSQTATLDPSSGIIYYLGGSYFTSEEINEINVGFAWAYVFNTASGYWLNETLMGDIPSKRKYHSANLLPNSRDIIVYGGTENDTEASADYCFTLNLIGNTWTKQSKVNVPSNLSGPRYSHSSVLVNTTLFILFGKGLNGTAQSSLISINVANIADIVYTPIFDVFSSPNNNTIPPTNNNTSGNGAKSSSSSGLSKGAIGGIAAGIAVMVTILVLAVIAGTIICVRRKTKSDRHSAANDYDEYSSEKIHVTWNKIDNQYRDIPPVNSSVTNSPHPASSMEATRVETSSPDAAPTLRSQYIPNLANINVMEDDDFSVVDQQHEKNLYSKSAYS